MRPMPLDLTDAELTTAATAQGDGVSGERAS
jgi:hypothetical protein